MKLGDLTTEKASLLAIELWIPLFFTVDEHFVQKSSPTCINLYLIQNTQAISFLLLKISSHVHVFISKIIILFFIYILLFFIYSWVHPLGVGMAGEKLYTGKM